MFDTDTVDRWLAAGRQPCLRDDRLGGVGLRVSPRPSRFARCSSLETPVPSSSCSSRSLLPRQHHLLAGELADAAALIDEERTIAVAISNEPVGYTVLALVALRGDEIEASRLIADTLQDATTRDQGAPGDVRVVRPEPCSTTGADVTNQRVTQPASCSTATSSAMACSSPPKSRRGRVADWRHRAGVDRVLDWLNHRAPALSTLGLAAWPSEPACTALLDDGATTDGLYRESIELLSWTPMRGPARPHPPPVL